MGTRIQELEDVILDQIEKLNDDSIFDDKEKAALVIEKSKAISSLADSFIDVGRLKLSIVRELNDGGGIYDEFLGIEAPKKKGTK